MKVRTLVSHLAEMFGVQSRQMNREVVTPTDARAAFSLRLGALPVGVLAVERGEWTFRYAPEFSARTDMRPLPIFPDVNKVYHSHELWSFFRMRVPSLKQPSIGKIVEKEGIDSNDQVQLLKPLWSANH